MKTQRTIAFNKVQWADYYYQNQDGDKLRYEPKKLTVHGISFEPDAFAVYHRDYPLETLLERAKRLDILDRWHPVCVLVFTANKSLRYTGKEATKVWKAYNSHIYGK